MTVLTVPDDKGKWYPSLGGQVCDFIEENLVFGPGDLRGIPAKLDRDKRALIWRMYEVYPQGHPVAGRRRFKRCALSLAKGLAKTELAAWIAICELHPESPVRCTGFDRKGHPIGGPVTDPYIPVVAYTEEQSDELCYGTIKTVLEECALGKDFDIGLERIMRKRGDGKVVSLSSSPNARDGARTTFQVADEPLSIATPVPTPDGWTTMGQINPGDYVLSKKGTPCRVIGVSEIKIGRPCYRVTFGDGTSIIADGSHLWRVYDRSPSYRCERSVTTEFMYSHTWSSSSKRFRVVKPKALELPDVKLPIDPYLLGFWLGDGDSRNATLSIGAGDLNEVTALINNLGYKTTQCNTGDNTPLIYVTLSNSRFSGWGATKGKPENRSVVGLLRAMGLLKNKHIPKQYLRAGSSQRLALLQGLMDSDGYINDKGCCTFSNSNVNLIHGVTELLRTLGYRPKHHTVANDFRWSSPKQQFKLNFRADCDRSPFRLERKLKKILVRQPEPKSFSIISIKPVGTVPVKCIKVANEDHLFLAGDGMMPTHNTHWWTLRRLLQTHQTMMANLPKRKEADPWALEVTTAPEPGAGSVAEHTMEYAQAVAEGRIKDSRLFYYHRQAGEEHELETPEDVRAAVIEASGEAARWRDIDAIVALSQDPTTDLAYFDRVYCNRLVKATLKAFDSESWKKLKRGDNPVKDGDLITLGFDGAMFHDGTAIVGTHIESGYQFVLGAWECPPGKTDWQIDEVAVDEAVTAAFQRYRVWRLYADPPYWQSWVATWAGRYGKEQVVEWYTNRRRQMSYALESFETGIKSGEISHEGNPILNRHIANCFRSELKMRDPDTGKRFWLIHKERSDSPNKIDAAMAAVLSWQARLDAVKLGVKGGASIYETQGVKAF